MENVCLAWSGGKDSSLALHRLQAGWLGANCRVTHLLTTVTEPYQRVSMHGVRRSLLQAQARSAGLELIEVMIPAPCPMEAYDRLMGAAMVQARAAGVRRIAFGDLFLADIRAYRENRLEQAGMEAVFPLWGEDTRQLAEAFIARGFKANLVCVDTEQLDPSFVGRPFDAALLSDLPPGVDPCGERGEFHTFVWDGPIFFAPIRHCLGPVEDRGRFHYCELLPE